MAITRNPKILLHDQIKKDPEFAYMLQKEAAELAIDEPDIARLILRELDNATNSNKTR